MPTAVLIFNEASGFHLSSEGALDATLAALRERGVETRALKGDLGAQLAESRQAEADIVIVDGGDGTIRSAIETHLDGGRPIGIVPGGTMNLLATDYGVPTDREEAVAVIAAGVTRAVDVGVAGGRVFLHSALAGMPVRLGVHRENRRGRMRLFDKVHLAFHALSTLTKDPRLTLDAEDETGTPLSVQSKSFAIVVGTVRERMLPAPHRDSVTAGVLSVFALDPESAGDIARLFIHGAFGKLGEDESVERLTVTTAEIRGIRRRMRAMLDGEATLLPSPARFEIRPGAIRVFAPPQPEGEAGS